MNISSLIYDSHVRALTTPYFGCIRKVTHLYLFHNARIAWQEASSNFIFVQVRNITLPSISSTAQVLRCWNIPRCVFFAQILQNFLPCSRTGARKPTGSNIELTTASILLPVTGPFFNAMRNSNTLFDTPRDALRSLNRSRIIAE